MPRKLLKFHTLPVHYGRIQVLASGRAQHTQLEWFLGLRNIFPEPFYVRMATRYHLLQLDILCGMICRKLIGSYAGRNRAFVDKILGRSRHRDGTVSDICRYKHGHILVSVDMGVRSHLLVIV